MGYFCLLLANINVESKKKEQIDELRLFFIDIVKRENAFFDRSVYKTHLSDAVWRMNERKK